MKDQKKACQLADEALQQALDKIDELGEDDFRDAKSIIELLKENLTLWKEEEEGGQNIEDLWFNWTIEMVYPSTWFFYNNCINQTTSYCMSYNRLFEYNL